MSTKEREEAMNEYGFNTGLLHGTNEKYPQGATQVPIYQSSAFRHDSAEDLEKIFDNKKMGFSYTRINNPTVESFEKRVTMLEDGIGSVACIRNGSADQCVSEHSSGGRRDRGSLRTVRRNRGTVR